MKHQPRRFNRIMLFLVGLVMLAAGVGLAVGALWAPAAAWWQKNSARWLQVYGEWAARYRAWDSDVSWLTVGWISAVIIIVLLCVVWIVKQASTRTILGFRSPGEAAEEGGKTFMVSAVIGDYCNLKWKADPWIAHTIVSSWRYRRRPGLTLKIFVNKGAPLDYLHAQVREATAEIHSLLGFTPKVMAVYSVGMVSGKGPALT